MTMDTLRPLSVLRGTVGTIIFSKSGYTVGTLWDKKIGTITFVGNVVVDRDQPVVLHGKYVEHPRYGRQFEVALAEFDREIQGDGLSAFLQKNSQLKGIGPKKAASIVAKYGKNFDKAIRERPEEIAKACKIKLDTVMSLQDMWTKGEHTNVAMTILYQYGLTPRQVKKLLDKMGNNAAELVKKNPYELIGAVPGLGFKRVDAVARRSGVPDDSPYRLAAGIAYAVQEASDFGHCWAEEGRMLTRAAELLELAGTPQAELLPGELDGLKDKGTLICREFGELTVWAMPKLYHAERTLLSAFSRANEPAPMFVDCSNVEAELDKLSPTLNDHQREAVLNATRHSITLISGGAGSGKTYSVDAIVKLTEFYGGRVTLCAPTGKAARRMEEATKRPASTIHRLLGLFEDDQIPTARVEDPVIVVDEVSMLDVSLAAKLFLAIDFNRTSLILVGDHNQLPPVGPGNVLRDLINSKVVPTVILDKVIRQAGTLKMNSTAILNGDVAPTLDKSDPEYGSWFVIGDKARDVEVRDYVCGLFAKVLCERMGFDILRDVQLLIPTRKGPLGCNEMNIHLQRLIQWKLWHTRVDPVPEGRNPRYYRHDKVIQIKNNYDIDVMNGTIGFILDIAPDGDLLIDFEGREVQVSAKDGSRSDLQLAYALTIHKAQGSEFPCSIVVNHRCHKFMLHRNLLYTGVTRASKTAIVVGDWYGIKSAAECVRVDDRKTFLSLLLK